MNCSDVQELLSAYYDGELPDEVRSNVDEHLGRCSECPRELAAFEKLSTMASGFSTPEPPKRIWTQLEKQLDETQLNVRTQLWEGGAPREGEAPAEPAVRPESHPPFPKVALDHLLERKLRWPLAQPRLLALAATILMAAGIGWFAYDTWLAPEEHDHLAVDFAQYLEEFEEDPAKAQQFLVAKYGGQALDIDASAERLGYRPAIADGLPNGLTLISTHVMKMPCCTCMGSLCQRDDGSTLAIFEHDEEQPVWFGDRPAISASCCGKRCSLMQVESDLVVGWQQGRRHITVIGARDLEEINQLVAWLDDRQPVRSK